MKNEIYASTGTFIGMANGFDHNIIKEKAKEIDCSGFELLILTAWHDDLDDIIRQIASFGIDFPVIHFAKGIGILFAENTADAVLQARRDFSQNVEAAKRIGAKKAVLHLWGGPNSDLFVDYSVKYLPEFYRECEDAGIELLIENIPAKYHGPVCNWLLARKNYHDVKFIYDTRFGEFHAEHDRIFSPAFWRDVKHIHVSSFLGNTERWGLLRPILHPGEGRVDIDSLLARMPRYDGTVTLESPVLAADGSIDTQKLNRSLELLRRKFAEKEEKDAVLSGNL